MIPVNPRPDANFHATSTSAGFVWDGGRRKTVTLITTPLAAAQLALLLERAEISDYPEAYRALNDLREILDVILARSIPSAREQWDQMKNDRDHLLTQLNAKHSGGCVGYLDRENGSGGV